MTAVRTTSPLCFAASVLAVAAVALLPARAWGGEAVKGSGVLRTEARGVSGFHAIALAVPANVTLRQRDAEGASITTDDNVLPLIETVVENGSLKIRWARRHLSLDVKRLDITIDVKSIDAIAVRGSGDIRAAQLKAGTLRIAIDGSGDVVFEALDADALEVAIRGDGDFKAAGRVETLDVSVAGSGDVITPKLASRRARVTLNGSAHATVWAQDALTATIAGSGDIKYYGKPKVTQTVAGSGSIRSAGDAS